MTDACSFASRLQRVLAALPPTWQICYIGYHETGGDVPSAADWAGGVAVAEVHAEESLTGLFGYLLRKVHPLSSPLVHPLSTPFSTLRSGVVLTNPLRRRAYLPRRARASCSALPEPSSRCATRRVAYLPH